MKLSRRKDKEKFSCILISNWHSRRTNYRDSVSGW